MLPSLLQPRPLEPRGWAWALEPLESGSSPDHPFLSFFSLTSEGRVLIHFGGSLTGAEEESVLVPVGEHRQAATAGCNAYREEGKDSASRCSPGFHLSPSASLAFKPWI